jgi:MFS family permease
MRSGPLANSYPAAVALVVLALAPFLMLTAAVLPLAKTIAPDVGLSPAGFDLTVVMSDAAYAFGTVLAVQFAQHLRQRRMLLGYVTLFVVASVLTAAASSELIFVIGFVVQGLCTSLMLIAAVPPLVTGWSANKMPGTAMIMNLCIFGAVAVGPTLGAWQASVHHWRPLFWVVAGLGVLAWAFALLTFKDDERADAEAPWDVVAIVLAGAGCAAGFYGAGRLQGSSAASSRPITALVVGVLLVVLLVVYQYRTDRPLMPVRQLATTYPVTGLVIALFGSAAAFGLMELILTALQSTRSPTQVALLFVPEFVAALATAAVFALVFRTRFIPALPFAGLALLAVGAALSTVVVTGGSDALVCVTTALIGLGVGASVSPALFLAGFSLRSSQIQRVFALIELLRGVTAFLVAPVLVFAVAQIGATSPTAIRDGVWICLAITVIGAATALSVFLTGGGRLQAPDLERWQGDGEAAWETPRLLATRRPVPGPILAQTPHPRRSQSQRY